MKIFETFFLQHNQSKTLEPISLTRANIIKIIRLKSIRFSPHSCSQSLFLQRQSLQSIQHVSLSQCECSRKIKFHENLIARTLEAIFHFALRNPSRKRQGFSIRRQQQFYAVSLQIPENKCLQASLSLVSPRSFRGDEEAFRLGPESKIYVKHSEKHSKEFFSSILRISLNFLLLYFLTNFMLLSNLSFPKS